MALAQWFIPELTDAAAFEIEKGKRVIRGNISQEPNRVAELCCSLLEQSVIKDSILRKAVHHVAELEAVIALLPTQGLAADPAPAPPQVFVAEQTAASLPLPLRWMLRLYGYSMVPQSDLPPTD